MVAQSAGAAIDAANSYKSCDPGMCLKYTRTWLGIASAYESAKQAWDLAEHRHPGDKKPPPGAPIFWAGGSSGYGHIALVRQHDMRSTDVPSSGNVGNDDGSYPRIHWGQNYLGWSEDLNGVWIPYLKAGGDWRAGGDVYVAKLHKGQNGSDSVSRLRYRLDNHPGMQGSGHRPGYGSGYGKECVEAVRYWQRNIAPQVKGPDDGESLSNPQAQTLFGDKYRVIEK